LTVADHEDLFERLYRDLGAKTPLQYPGLRASAGSSRASGSGARRERLMNIRIRPGAGRLIVNTEYEPVLAYRIVKEVDRSCTMLERG
jgi:hypothetical protein